MLALTSDPECQPHSHHDFFHDPRIKRRDPGCSTCQRRRVPVNSRTRQPPSRHHLLLFHRKVLSVRPAASGQGRLRLLFLSRLGRGLCGFAGMRGANPNLDVFDAAAKKGFGRYLRMSADVGCSSRYALVHAISLSSLCDGVGQQAMVTTCKSVLKPHGQWAFICSRRHPRV